MPPPGPGGNMPNYFGGPQPSPQPPGQQMRTAPPPMQGSGNYNLLPSTPFSNAAATSGANPSPGGAPSTNSPIQAASSEMNSAASGNPLSISSPLDSKKDILQSKLLSPLSSGYQGSSTEVSSQNADLLLQGGGIPSLPPVNMNIKEEPVSSTMGQVTNSPHPPPSVEMNTECSLPSVHSLPPIDSKKDIFQAKVATPPSSGFQDLPAPASQSADPLLPGGGGLPEPKSSSGSTGNQRVVSDPSLLKGMNTLSSPLPSMTPFLLQSLQRKSYAQFCCQCLS